MKILPNTLGSGYPARAEGWLRMRSLGNIKSSQRFSRLPLLSNDRDDASQSSSENSRRKPIVQSFGCGRDQRRLRILLGPGVFEPT